MNCYAGERSRILECVELHVFFVPEEQWNSRLNKVSVEAIGSFISAGFIRVYPDTSLKTVRDDLGTLLELDRLTDKYYFLKCVGRSLALVKVKQEKDLKVKSFAPPYSLYPELYLLPVDEYGSSLCSRSLSPDTVFYNAETPRQVIAPVQTKEPIKFPQIKQGPQLSVVDQPEGLEDEGSFSSQEEKEEYAVECGDPVWIGADSISRSVQEEFGIKQYDADILPIKMEKKTKKTCHKRNFARDSGVPESLEDPDTGKFHSQQSKSSLKPTVKKLNDEDRAEPRVPVTCDATPNDPYLALHIQPSLTNRDEMLKELRQVKEERKQLEKTRQELLRKGKELLALNRHRRNQARDKWKKKYFDTKKATVPLEETLKSLQQELEAFYDKLFQQLQARDGRNRQRRTGKPSSTKNNLIIEIMTASWEIDNLKKNLDDAKMKLATENKLKKQATTELQALKAELMQKKSQCSFAGPH